VGLGEGPAISEPGGDCLCLYHRRRRDPADRAVSTEAGRVRRRSNTHSTGVRRGRSTDVGAGAGRIAVGRNDYGWSARRARSGRGCGVLVFSGDAGTGWGVSARFVEGETPAGARAWRGDRDRVRDGVPRRPRRGETLRALCGT